MIKYVEFTPSPFLLPFVECIWSLRSHSRYLKKRELIIPGGRIELIFNFSDGVDWIDSKDLSTVSSHAGAYLLGPRNRHFFVEQKGIIDMVGVRFRHGGLASYTQMPMSMLMNEVVFQDQVFGKDVDALMYRLLETVDSKQHIILIEDFLAKRFQAEPRTVKTFQLISLVKGCESLSSFKTLGEKTGVHYKKLERVFAQYTGYSPKNFSRVMRFYKALREMKESSTSLTDIGLNQGYYDQPHFIRDFKAFTGKSPTQFHAENPVIANLLLQSQNV